ncbi:hypothetical protein [Thiopseudomonas denitrificans]|uniref:Uncharacterized protein n=1 Tax=Thiopseudomonas denitrificans TaxID=1501432 RepID=A0A4R6TR43_9GAMM|nr:hypothetical protein [Thiopseudomonas denitrificans]TDQ35459.1 hypothetical protein DFQ45_1158 [Thiopseudomonas denitrificans]
MHIVASDGLQFRTEHSKVFGREVSETLDFSSGNQRIQYQRHERETFASAELREASVSFGEPKISRQALERYADSLPAASASTEEENLLDFDLDEAELGNLRLLLAALARLNGEFERFAGMYESAVSSHQLGASLGSAGSTAAVAPAARGGAPGASLSYDYHVTQWQEEQLKFSGSGQVTTADGRTIDMSLELQMQHSQYSHESVSIRAGARLQDPLVINYGGNAVGLTSQTMQFDLDADGRKDTLAMLANGSAYLALDKNGNGKIDDGRELFGAITGNGFTELAGHDDDGNGFIDSGDAVFESLKLWIPDQNGQGRLIGLKEAGIGALALKHAEGGFDLIANGELQGQVRSTGLFLFEDGRVGSMQQIDLVM